MNEDALEHLVLAGHVPPIVEALGESASVRHRRWLLDALGRALDRADPSSLPEAVVSRLRELELAEGRLEAALEPPPEHAVLVPLVPPGDKPSFARLMIVTHDRSGSLAAHGLVDLDARLAIEDALRAARDRLGWRTYGDLCLTPVRMRSLLGTRIHGSSIGAGTFVSATALLERRSVHRGTAATGAIVGKRLLSVGAMEQKIRALVGRADVERFVVPAADHAHAMLVAHELGFERDVIGCRTVDELLDACLSKRRPTVRHIDAEVTAARQEWDRAWQDFRWGQVRERLSRLLTEIPRGRPDLEVRVLTMLAACHRHLGTPEAPLELLSDALAILETPEGDAGVDEYERSFLYRHLALAEKDLGHFEEAERAALEAKEHARIARKHGAVVSALGTAGLIALARRDAAAGVVHLREALGIARSFDVGRVPRTLAYLTLANGRAGDLEAAQATFEEGLALLATLGDEPRTHTDEQWLRTYMADAAMRCGAPTVAVEVLSHPCVVDAMQSLALPGLIARRWLGLAEIETGSVSRGLSRLAAAPGQHPHAGEGAERVRFFAHLAVLYEVHARAKRSLLDDDARGRALLALEHLPSTGDGGARIAPLIASARRHLSPRNCDDAALPAALGALLEACIAFE